MDAPTGTAVRLRDVSKSYGPVKVLDISRLDLERGQIVAVVGENGAGKSTLMGVLSGTMSPTTGTIEIAGELLAAGRPDYSRELGVACSGWSRWPPGSSWSAPTPGRQVYAVGGNAEAARLAGIRGDRRVVSMYVTSSLLSAFAGIMVLGRMGVGSASGVGVGWELSAIAAAVIGGVSPVGGQGRILGIVAGTILAGTDQQRPDDPSDQFQLHQHRARPDDHRRPAGRQIHRPTRLTT
jgi:energy-coupling factor transporter ATP-binding protein EcfA2